MEHYCPIYILPCFSKILERMIYDRFYSFFFNNDILYEKQFVFQRQHSTDHMTVRGHNILLKKLFHYGARDNNFKVTYIIKTRIAYQITSKIEYKNVICDVPRKSILGPSLFLIFINDLQHSKPLLETTSFADDTYLSYSHNNVKELFGK